MTTDDDARRFGDVYGMTKVFGEMMLEHYRDRHGLSVVALRYGGIRQLVAQIFGMTMTWATSGQLTDLRDALSANLLAMQSELPRLSYLVLPTTVLDPTSLARHDWQPKPALLEALPWLTSDDVPDDLPRPRALFDASVIESDLGLKFQASQEDFIREALVGSVEPVGAA